MKRFFASSSCLLAAFAYCNSSAWAQSAPVEEDVEIEAVAAPPPTAAEPPAAPSSAVSEPAPPAATSAAAPEAGTAVAEQSPSAAAAAPSPPPSAAVAVAPPSAAATTPDAEREALEARLRALEAAAAAHAEQAEAWLGFRFSAFIQAQYEHSQLSEDQLLPGGTPRNRDRFLVRRARLRVQRSWTYVDLDFELDANTVDGLDVAPRRATGSVFWPAADPALPPLARAQLGLQDIPFGYELPMGSRTRVFAERSRASLAFFPREPDIGAVLSGALGPVRYAAAVFNGQEAHAEYGIRDANAAKDFVARAGVELAPYEWLSISSGVSFLEGTGFHAGDDATKNDLSWNDINEDGSKSDAEIMGVPGSAATPSSNFDRWGVNFDAAVGLRTTLGWSRLYGEVTFAQNLDRGLFVADPVASSLDSRELGYYVAFVQELGRYALVGFRTDFYNGNSDFFEKRRGESTQLPQTVRTYSPLVGLVLPKLARLTLQYDFVDDELGRDDRAVPADLANNQWVLRLQVGL